jgi:hypothetical protein
MIEIKKRITITIEPMPESWVEPLSGEKRGHHTFDVGQNLITVNIPERLYSDEDWEGKALFGRTLECLAEALLWSLQDTDSWLTGRRKEGGYGPYIELEPCIIARETHIFFQAKLQRARAYATGSWIERVRRFFGH